MAKKISTEEFIKRMKAKVNTSMDDFSKVQYNGKYEKICITCKEHGDYWITPESYGKGHRCPICGSKNGAIVRSDNQESFLLKMHKKYGDKYDFSKFIYKGYESKGIVICPIHGEFIKTAHDLTRGTQCPKCGHEHGGLMRVMPQDEFIKRAKLIHDNYYTYDKTVYVTQSENVIITCPVHGDFWQTPRKHLMGSGCPFCGREKVASLERLDMKRVIEKAKQIHGDKYVYDKNFVYKNNKEKMPIICPKHGLFYQEINSHLQGGGCPKCTNQIAKWEQDVADTIMSFGITLEQSNRKILNGKEIDIYLPQYNIGIECDGLRWHNELFRNKNYHLDKTILCGEKGVRLIHIFEDEWKYKKDIWVSMLKNIFGINTSKIYARKCTIQKVPSNEAKAFLDANHIQGSVASPINLGLYYDNELVSLMTFGKPRINLGGVNKDGSYELVRFVNKLNLNVVGGASKLFKHFLKNYNPQEIVSYADKRWSLGNLYYILEFEHSHDSAPNYYYVNEFNRENRFKYRKSMLVKEGFDQSKSEHEIMKERGIYRIYDCGTMVFKWHKKE